MMKSMMKQKPFYQSRSAKSKDFAAMPKLAYNPFHKNLSSIPSFDNLLPAGFDRESEIKPEEKESENNVREGIICRAFDRNCMIRLRSH
jgi:hypothetical protein